MDYIEAFQNLKTNQKYSRKSPHKAVLLLTVIKMYENGLLSDNEIKYDGTLTRTFKQVWNNLLPHETKFYPDAYLPYWYLQNESFWHIIPIRGQESVLQLMRDEHIKPSETKLQNCVSYAELDEELYFQMTMPSSRRNLKQALLETYFALSDHEINAILNNEPQNLNEQINVADTFKDVFVDEPKGTSGFDGLTEDVQICLNLEYFTYLKNHRYEREEFKEFFPDVESLYKRIAENPLKNSEVSSSFEFEYSNFLRDLKISLMSEDGAMDFVDSIDHALDVLENDTPDDVEGSDYQEESYSEVDDSAAQNDEDLSEDSAVETVYVESPSESYRRRMEYSYYPEYQTIEDTVTHKSDSLPELPEAPTDRKGKPWTDDEDITVKFYYEKGYTTDAIARALGRTEVSIKSRLGLLGVIEYDYEKEHQVAPQQSIASQLAKIEEPKVEDSCIGRDFFIENTTGRCYIYNKENRQVYSSSGKLKVFHGEPYRMAFSYSKLSMNLVDREDDSFVTGERIVNASSRSSLYKAIKEAGALDAIEDVIEENGSYLIKVYDEWFDSLGNESSFQKNSLNDWDRPQFETDLEPKQEEEPANDMFNEADFDYEPKGKLRKIPEEADSTYEFLWVMAISDLQELTNRQTNFTLDNIACMMIANAWELLNIIPGAKAKEESLNSCIEYLIEESKEYMDTELSWNSSKEDVYDAIKSYPMAGAFEDTVEELVQKVPVKILKLWFPDIADEYEVELISQMNSSPSLYAFYNKRIDPYIVVNKKWQNNLYYEHDKIVKYFAIQYKKFLEDC